MQKSGHMVLKGVNRVYNDEIGSNGVERSQLGTQCKNQVICSWKESIGWVYNDKIGSNGLERSQLGTQYKNFYIVYKVDSLKDQFTQLGTQCIPTLLTPFKNIWPDLWKEYPIWSTINKISSRFHHCIPYWVNSEYTYDLKFALCTQWTSWKESIWSTIIKLVPYGLLERSHLDYYSL